MIHARSDYNRIQDPENKIPKEEPVFLLRAQDTNAPFIVRMWADLAERQGASPEIVNAAREHSIEMIRWQNEHGSKTPDL